MKDDPLIIKRNGKPIDLHGLWAPNPGFLVCAGPSINDVDYMRLRDRGIVSLAVNQVAAKVPVRAWCFSDPGIKFHHGLYLDPAMMTFAPNPKLGAQMAIRRDREEGWRWSGIRFNQCPNTFGFDRKTMFVPEEFYETPFAHWGPSKKQPKDRPFKDGCLCTMMIGLRILNYLGVKRIYLLGVDFVGRNGMCYGFDSTKKERNKRFKWEANMLEAIKPEMAKRGITVYNCNPVSSCRAFEHVPFEAALEDCRGDVPEGELDTHRWYEKKTIMKDCEANEPTRAIHYDEVDK